MDCFDADVLIYAAVPGHPLGSRVASLLKTAEPGERAGAGSVLLLPEVLGKPLRDGTPDEVRALTGPSHRRTRHRAFQPVPAPRR
jgi:hypothetical protein